MSLFLDVELHLAFLTYLGSLLVSPSLDRARSLLLFALVGTL